MFETLSPDDLYADQRRRLMWNRPYFVAGSTKAVPPSSPRKTTPTLEFPGCWIVVRLPFSDCVEAKELHEFASVARHFPHRLSDIQLLDHRPGHLGHILDEKLVDSRGDYFTCPDPGLGHREYVSTFTLTWIPFHLDQEDPNRLFMASINDSMETAFILLRVTHATAISSMKLSMQSSIQFIDRQILHSPEATKAHMRKTLTYRDQCFAPVIHYTTVTRNHSQRPSRKNEARTQKWSLIHEHSPGSGADEFPAVWFMAVVSTSRQAIQCDHLSWREMLFRLFIQEPSSGQSINNARRYLSQLQQPSINNHPSPEPLPGHEHNDEKHVDRVQSQAEPVIQSNWNLNTLSKERHHSLPIMTHRHPGDDQSNRRRSTTATESSLPPAAVASTKPRAKEKNHLRKSDFPFTPIIHPSHWQRVSIEDIHSLNHQMSTASRYLRLNVPTVRTNSSISPVFKAVFFDYSGQLRQHKATSVFLPAGIVDHILLRVGLSHHFDFYRTVFRERQRLFLATSSP